MWWKPEDKIIDLNHSRTIAADVSDKINKLVEGESSPPSPRDYLGASGLGHACARKVQLDWKRPAPISPQTQRIFDRGHWGELIARQALWNAGFRIKSDQPQNSFSQMEGAFQGHVDGVVEDGPEVSGLRYPCLWECKTISKKNWLDLAESGLKRKYPVYYTQVQLYMTYCDLSENPCLFTALCADDMSFLHLLVKYDAKEAQRASDKAVMIIKATEAGELLDRISDDSDRWPCMYCSHREFCHGRSAQGVGVQ